MTASAFEFSRAAAVACGCKFPMTDVAAAVHEAGHAVIGRVLGFPCGEAEIEPATGTMNASGVARVERVWVAHGRVYADGERGEHFTTILENNIILNMGGVIAERVVLNYRHESPGDGHDQANIETFRKLLRWPGGWRAARQRLEQRTEELTDKHRDAIRRVAFALLKHRKLDGPAITALL